MSIQLTLVLLNACKLRQFLFEPSVTIPKQPCAILGCCQCFENGSRKIDTYLQRVEVKQTSISIETNGSLVLKSRTGDRSGNCNNQHSELSRICFLTRPLYIKHRYFIDTVCRHQQLCCQNTPITVSLKQIPIVLSSLPIGERRPFCLISDEKSINLKYFCTISCYKIFTSDVPCLKNK